MKTFCQIEYNKAWWIFEADTAPEFSPCIIIKDITNIIPQPQEGWDYNASTDTLSAPTVYVPTLADAKQTKLTQIDDLYNKSLTVGFSSSASGASVKYGYSDEEQATWNDLDRMESRGWVTYPFSVYDQDGTPVSITSKTQLDQLFQDIFLFKYPLKLKQHAFINQVNACTSIDQVNGLVITF